MRSPIKYYGGKSYMAKMLVDRFPRDYDLYVEGFGGGASVLFTKEQSGMEVYNDLYDGVYSLYKVLQDDEMAGRLIDRMSTSCYSRRFHDEYRDDLVAGGMSIEDTAYKYLYVNRSSFNGVGGFSVTKLPRRGMMKSTSDWLSMVDGLEDVHRRLSTVVIENLDIFELIRKYDSPSTFFYLDPPYVWSTRKSSQRYGVEMTDADHEEFVRLLYGIEGKALVTIYDSRIYDGLASHGFAREDLTRPNSKDTETIYRNYDLNGAWGERRDA